MLKILSFSRLKKVAKSNNVSVVVKHNIQSTEYPDNLRVSEVHLCFESEFDRHDSMLVGNVTLNPDSGNFVVLHKENAYFLEMLGLTLYNKILAE